MDEEILRNTEKKKKRGVILPLLLMGGALWGGYYFLSSGTPTDMTSKDGLAIKPSKTIIGYVISAPKKDLTGILPIILPSQMYKTPKSEEFFKPETPEVIDFNTYVVPKTGVVNACKPCPTVPVVSKPKTLELKICTQGNTILDSEEKLIKGYGSEMGIHGILNGIYTDRLTNVERTCTPTNSWYEDSSKLITGAHKLGIIDNKGLKKHNDELTRTQRRLNRF